jgi:hypothetical protein
MQTFKWKAEIEFEGSVDEFKKLADFLNKQPLVVRIPEWDWVPPGHLAGCNPFPLEHLIDKDFLKILAEKSKAKIPIIKDIAGGIRTAHVHLADEVVLLDRENFRIMVGQVAKTLAERRAETVEDYVDVMGPVDRLTVIPSQPR